MKHKLGKYGLLTRSFSALARSGIDLSTCTVEELQQFPGIKSKTARFFILHSRRDQELAVIDTHILKELRRLGLTQLRTIPTGKNYIELERVFIEHLKTQSVTDFAAYDLDIWKRYTRNRES
jgi:thermostable 8-oxoguanine DNA glycosylase